MNQPDRLKAALTKTDAPATPASTWEILANARITRLESDFAGLRKSIDTLLWSIAATIAIAAISLVLRAL